MNYLSHFHVNLRSGDHAPEFHFGVALPDLLSAYDRKLRFTALTSQTELARSDCKPLWLGILNHLEMDARFHRSEKFKAAFESVRQLLIPIVPAGMNCRPFFLAHIAVEMLLDHNLLKNDPDLAKRFYRTLGGIDRHAIHFELEKHFGDNLNRFEIHFQRFMEVRFLEFYADLENVTDPINRMLRRTRQDVFTGDAAARLTETLKRASRMIEGQHILDTI